MKKFLLLGSGELGKEFTIAAKRYGFYVVAVDKYANAPAMQVADESEIIDMLDGSELENVVIKHSPDYIVPEVESICVEKLFEFEKNGIIVVPSANAVNVAMNREETREFAKYLNLPTAKYEYANTVDGLKRAATLVGFPCVIKPLMSSSGKGQTVVKCAEQLEYAWEYAMKGSRGNIRKIIVEEFIELETEFTLLTITQNNGETKFCVPIEHIQSNGDYVESWQPSTQKYSNLYEESKKMAMKITEALGGSGLWGVEFFITKGCEGGDGGKGKERLLFSELSPRPHDTGMVTLCTQQQNEFELHLRSIMGWEIDPRMNMAKSGASAAILANCEGKSETFLYKGLEEAAKLGEFRIFGKPEVWKNRRMGVAFTYDEWSHYNQWTCRKKAKTITDRISVNLL